MLLQNRHYTVTARALERIVFAVRTAEPFATKDDVDTSCGAVMLALDRFGRGTSCLLLDSRLATGRNDPEFDQWFAPYRRGTLIGFLRTAILVQTAVGRLQTDRLLREDQQSETKIRAFTDEVRAVAWLREALAAI